MGNRHREFDVTHPFAPHAGESDFNAATIADHALVLDPLVFPARAFPVAGWTENAFAEKATLLRLEGAVIDCLRILNFSLAPGAHRVARGDADCDLIETNGALF